MKNILMFLLVFVLCPVAASWVEFTPWEIRLGGNLDTLEKNDGTMIISISIDAPSDVIHDIAEWQWNPL
jgi:hypothetical protein